MVKSRISQAIQSGGIPSILLRFCRPRIDLNMINIPGGEFIFQNVEGVRVNGFRVSRDLITNAQYKVFCDSTGYQLPAFWDDRLFGFEAEDETRRVVGHYLPVVGVSFYDAQEFAKWTGKRLLTELEWERAAAGPMGSFFPWGTLFVDDWIVFKDSHTRPINRNGVEMGKSVEGVRDLAGNVWEWTRSFYERIDFSMPRDPIFATEGESISCRGGAYWIHNLDYFKCSHRHGISKNIRDNSTGFRVGDDL